MKKSPWGYRLIFVCPARNPTFHKTLLVMKLTFILLVVAFLGARASGLSQSITFSGKNVSMKQVFAAIKKQTGYVVFTSDDILAGTKPVSLSVYNMPLTDFMDTLLKEQPLAFRVEEKTIVLTKKEQQPFLYPIAVKKNILAFPIKGRILGEDGQPLVGASIKIKGSTTGVSSDANGNFSLEAKSGQKLVISYTGYNEKEVPVSNDASYTITLSLAKNPMDEVVVIGYGTQNKRDITTSVASLKATDINNFPATGLDKALAGRLAGVQVMQTGGAPGAGISILIRGKGTITAGSDPLYVVDGLPLSDNDINGPGIKINPLNAININDIESIDVLKDASATAIYGSRGANGVIVVTTKRGKKAKPVFNFNAYAGTQQTNKKIPMLDAYQYAQLIYDAHNNTYFDLLADKGLTGSVSDDNATRLAKLLASPTNTSQAYLLPPDIFPYLNKTAGLTNTDWQDEIFRTAPQQNYSLSVAGGSDNVRYYISGNYMDQRGIVLNSGYKKYGTRINIDANYSRLKLGATINFNHAVYDNQQTEGRFNGNLENVVSGALVASPFFPVTNADGTYNFDQYKWQYAQAQLINPVAMAMLKSDNITENKLLGNVFAEYELVKDLKYRLSFGANITDASRSSFRPSTLPNTLALTPPSIPSGGYRNIQLLNWVLEHTVSYNKNFGDHSLKTLAGFTAQRENRLSSNTTATGYPNDMVKTLNAATSITGGSTVVNEWSLLSGLARAQYSFKNKYLLSAAIRGDGSSRFGPNNKWGYFPSASAGWIVSDETFMERIKAVSALKLRASFGVTGNFQIGNYAYLSSLGPDNYIFGPQGGTALASGLYQETPGNADLGWEKTTSFNLGLDLGLFNDRLNATIDVYNNNTNDLLLNVPVPLSSGYGTNLVNIGKVNNKGLEITLSNNNRIGELEITNSINYAVNRNKVLDLGGANSIVTQAQSVIYYITQVGKPVANYYTLVKTGVYKNQDEINHPDNAKVAGAKPGDFKYKDINKDGKIDGSNDREITGNYMPKFTYGFNTSFKYKILDLSAAVQGIYGNTIANVNKRHMDAVESFSNNTTSALDRWNSQDDPGNGIIARANRSQRGLNSTTSTYHLEDGSYLRIRDITLGVTIPAHLTSKVRITNARLYFTAQNPFTFTKYSGYNPEVSIDDNPLTPGIDYGTYPLSKAFFVGINLNF